MDSLSTDTLHNRRHERQYLQLLHSASLALSFSQDVVKDRGPDSLPYSQTDFRWLFDPPGLLAPTVKVKGCTQKRAALKNKMCLASAPEDQRESNTGRANTSTKVTLQLPPLFSTELPACPVKKKDPLLLQSDHRGVFRHTKVRGSGEKAGVLGSLKDTVSEKQVDSANTHQWDEFVLKKLTKTTAQWIVSQQVPGQSGNKARLQSLLKEQYGSVSVTDLVHEEPMSEKDFRSYQDRPRQEPEQPTVESTKPETPLPVYYRVPGFYLPPAHPGEPEGKNQTADNLIVKTLELPQPPRLQDSLNPRAGRHVYHTENAFEQELYSGISSQVHQRDERQRDRIIMENNSEYQKHLQDRLPLCPEEWSKMGAADTSFKTTVVVKTEKGAVRWVRLPSPADYATERGLRPPDYSSQDTHIRRHQPEYYPPRELQSLRYMVEEWRKAWKIVARWQNVTIEGLKRDLTDLHDHVRFTAIATCASGAVNRPSEDSNDTAQFGRPLDIQAVPEELQPLLTATLDDPSEKVRLAAALCQSAMGTPNKQAREILYSTLQQDLAGASADSWAAAQCLALEGEASAAVIGRLLSQLKEGEAPSDREQSTALLARLSTHTTLVRSLLAEELNSGNWMNRVLACDTISQLNGPINKDITNKLTFLMWNDWNYRVRQAAAQALGKKGMGREVHDELRVKLEEGPPCWRVEALSLLAKLEIMTAKLLPAFLRCLRDDFVAVRKQACLTASALCIKDELVVNELIRLMQTDPIWEVKVRAINALGKTGYLTPALQKYLLWALHHEEETEVRIASCDAIKALGLSGPKIQHFLQERLVLESNTLVQRKIEHILKSHGLSLDADRDMVTKIKEQVDRLCTKRVITQKLLMLEELEDSLLQQRRHFHRGSQPGALLTPPDMPGLLEAYYMDRNRPLSTSQLSETVWSTDEAEMQSLLDSFRSCSSATGGTTAATQGRLTLASHEKTPILATQLNSQPVDNMEETCDRDMNQGTPNKSNADSTGGSAQQSRVVQDDLQQSNLAQIKESSDSSVKENLNRVKGGVSH